MKRLYTILFLAISLTSSDLWAQESRLDEVRAKLKLAVIADTTFLSEVDLTVGHMPLGELLRNVAKASNVNVSYQGDNSLLINCNLSRAKITDLLFFLCRQYNLDIDVVGNIVSVYPYVPPLPEIPDPKVFFHPIGPALSYELHDTPLPEVARLLADASGINLVVPGSLAQKQVSGYAIRLPVDEGIKALAAGNELIAVKNSDHLWLLDPMVVDPEAEASKNWVFRREIDLEQLIVDSLGFITAQIQQGRIYDILCMLCERLGLNYYFISPIDGQTSLFLKDVELHTLLKVLFTGTPYSYYEEEGIYMFGASREETLASVRVVPLQNRTVSKLIEAIPPELKQGVQVQSFGEQNSIILSGDQRKVARIEHFIKTIDKTVPLVTIEVIIVDATKNRKNEQGISLGVREQPTATTGSLLGEGINMELGSRAINGLINSFNGFGAINLGKVNANFYANLKLLEASGDIELQSTPRLSTLNGHEAELKSGERRHYKEVNESLMGSQNPIQTSSYQWKYIDANLELKIAPLVSGNGEITLGIEISQTEFTSQEDNETPPGTATRSFKSEIRVQNEEMVLLGGIERNDRTKTSKGLPFVARAPLLKWLFGQSVDNNEARKLNIFIKPTVLY